MRISNYRKLAWSFTLLEKEVTDKHLLKDLDCVTEFQRVENLEAYHSLLNKYCAKILSFCYAGKYARTHHALLDHSCGVKRKKAATGVLKG